MSLNFSQRHMPPGEEGAPFWGRPCSLSGAVGHAGLLQDGGNHRRIAQARFPDTGQIGHQAGRTMSSLSGRLRFFRAGVLRNKTDGIVSRNSRTDFTPTSLGSRTLPVDSGSAPVEAREKKAAQGTASMPTRCHPSCSGLAKSGGPSMQICFEGPRCWPRPALSPPRRPGPR